MPFPKPILLNFESIPIVGTIAISIFFISSLELLQLKMPNAPCFTGNLYFTILKLISSIKGIYILRFCIRNFFIAVLTFGSKKSGKNIKIFLGFFLLINDNRFFSNALSA